MDATLIRTVIDLSGWLPAIIIPMATLIQLWEILSQRSAQGVSGLTWFLFGVANVGLYIYTEKYSNIQSIAGLLGSAILDMVIASLAFFNWSRPSEEVGTTPNINPK